MDLERLPSRQLYEGLLARARLAPVALRLFAVLWVSLEVVRCAISPNRFHLFGLIVSVAAGLGIIAGIWVVWFVVGFISLITIVIDVIGGPPWYEVAWPFAALVLLCWPSSWAYVNSGGNTEESASSEY